MYVFLVVLILNDAIQKIEEMRITIQDLEALKDLSDELEENHIESEKALQSDISLLTSQLYTKSQTIDTLTTSLSDAHSTLLQFRSLVIELQGEINEMRSQTQEAQSESQNAIGQQKLMAAVNMRLQSTAERNQGREVEMLVGRLELGLVKEELAVVEGYLPEVWSQPDHMNDSDGEAGGGLGVGDKDSLKCVLYFQRMAGKADIINEVVAKMHSLPEALDSPNSSSPITELLVGVCELRGRLSSLSTLCKRFASVLRRASPEWYLELGRALWVREDVGSLEKRMDLHVALLRGSGEPGKGEFRERECVQDVARLQAQFNHLAEVYLSPLVPQSSSSINGSGSTANQPQANSNTGGIGAGVSYNPLYDIAERELGSVELFDLDLDMFAASIGMMKTSVEGIVGSDSEGEFVRIIYGGIFVRKKFGFIPTMSRIFFSLALDYGRWTDLLTRIFSFQQSTKQILVDSTSIQSCMSLYRRFLTRVRVRRVVPSEFQSCRLISFSRSCLRSCDALILHLLVSSTFAFVPY